ncbi:response regulator [Lysobacter sp. KIS68-7]|uniref:response regulator transcription factor n=1 Tax=Lysobacter sp. KIS68-7 TaxID=2904252 RepID=UPI001E479BC2|nr:response regulator [Lysobacter sp. KIS68-7]UHQ20087.1 response regulator [Lysobacter sp. KIS68-7]
MPGRTPVVAVVEDEQPVRRALQRLLRASGFDVRLFSTGSEFMAHLEGIDCVILDLHLPGMSGFEVQEALSALGASLPVVVLTGNDTPANRTRSLANGAHAYLCKPVDDKVLLDALRPLTSTASMQ